MPKTLQFPNVSEIPWPSSTNSFCEDTARHWQHSASPVFRFSVVAEAANFYLSRKPSQIEDGLRCLMMTELDCQILMTVAILLGSS